MNATASAPTREHTVTWDDPVEARASARDLSGREWLERVKDGTLPSPPAARLFDMRIDEIDAGRVVFSMQPLEVEYNPAGTVHGGVLTTLVDTAMTTAVMSRLPAGAWAPTIEIKVNFIRPVTEATQRISAVGRVVHIGATTAVAEAQIIDQDGKLYAHATSTCAIKLGGA